MNRIFQLILISVTALLLSSCATLSKDECVNANWRTIGYEDGTKGYPASRIGAHRSACAEYGIRPDLDQYTAGRKQGLRQFCTPSNGYQRGSQGYNYAGVCVGYNEAAFLDGYNYGRDVYKAVQRLNSLRNSYNTELNYIRELEREMHEKEDLMLSGRLSKVKALVLLQETRDMAEELGKAKSNLNALSDEIAHQAEQVRYLKERSPY